MAKMHLVVWACVSVCPLFFFIPTLASSHDLLIHGKVLELDNSTFDSAISTHEFILVSFYAPWCGHCKMLNPELDIAAQLLAVRNEQIMIAKLDAVNHTKIAEKYEIMAYPTMKIFMHGIPMNYTGPRNADLLVKLLRKFVAPEVSILESDSAIHSFVETAGTDFPIFISFGMNETLFAEFARKYKSHAWFSIAKGFSEEVMVQYEFDKVPALVSLSPKYNEQNVMYGPFDGKFLDAFIRQSHVPLVVPINSETLWMLDPERKIVLTFMKDVLDEKSLKLVRVLRAAASANPDLVFGYVGVKQWREFAHLFDVSKKLKLPRMLIWNGLEEYHLVVGSESLNDDEDQVSQISRFLEGYRERRSVKISINNPSFMGYIRSLNGTHKLYIFTFVVAVVMLLQSFGRQDNDAPWTTKQICAKAANDTNRNNSVFEGKGISKGHQQTGDKKD